MSRRVSVANVITMAAVVYLALGTPKAYVRDGSISAYVEGSVDINDRTPLRVQVIPR